MSKKKDKQSPAVPSRRNVRSPDARRGRQAGAAGGPFWRRFPLWVTRLLWGLVTAAVVAPAFILGKMWRGEPWTWEEAAGAAAVMFVVFLFLATVRGYQR